MNDYRKDFPLLSREVNNRPLVYLDYAATTPKPRPVIDAVTEYYTNSTGNPGRSTHTLSHEAQQRIEETRQQILSFLGAKSNKYSVIFTKSATEALNLSASILSQHEFQRIVTMTLEHHSNFLPWKRLAEQKNKELVIIPTSNGELFLSSFPVTQKTIFAITHGSNVTGQILPLSEICAITEQSDVITVIDATQTIAHIPINLSVTPIDFLAFSAHKLYGPEGVGVLVVNKKFLTNAQPMIIGGGSVAHVSTEKISFKNSEEAFEAGTPNTAGIIGLSAAIAYLEEIGFETISQQERSLSEYLHNNLQNTKEFTVLGSKQIHSLPIYAFQHSSIHPHDIAAFLDEQGIAVRAGFHCAEPLHQEANSGNPTTRVSASFLNTAEEIDLLFNQLSECLKKYR